MEVITGKRVAEIFFSMQRHFENNGYSIAVYKWHPINMSLYRYVQKFPVKYSQVLGYKVKTERRLFDLLIPSMAEKDWYIIEFVDDLDERIKLSTKWKDRLSSVRYDFSQSCIEINNEGIKFDKKFGDWLIEKYTNREISLEVFSVWIKLLDLQFKDNFIWQKTTLSNKVLAYMKLINFDTAKYKDIFHKVIENKP